VRIVLTGPTGQVGSALLGSLQGEILPLSRERFDLATSAAEVIRAARPDVIVNAAAYTAVDRAEDEPGLAAAVNATAPGLLAEEAKRSGALLVHFSTDYVFDGAKSEAYVETDATNPLNVYGRTKLAGEDAIRASGCRHLILRTSWVYGPGGRNFLRAILARAEKHEPLRVVDDQFGAPTSSLMIAAAVPVAIAKVRAGAPGGLYHLSAMGQTSWHGFAKRILGNKEIIALRSDEYPAKARRPRNSVLDNTKIARELGIRMPSWEDGLRGVLEAVR
jgi:dTDP-4-dehydrorhamnose reductase